MRRFTVLAFLTFAVAGCGSADDERAIRATLEARNAALTTHQFERACELLTDAAQREWGCVLPDNTTLGNEAIVTFNFRTPRIADIDVDGDRAEVRYGSGEPTRMRKVGGRWLIDTFG